jgi:N-6 DNA Methylase
MTAVRALQEEFANIGYVAIVRDYVFSDVFAASTPNRKAPIVAFTHTPSSYRTAALAVVEADQRPVLEVISEYRALGAPLLFVIQGDEVVAWQMKPRSAPREIGRSPVNQLPALFATYREAWSPLSIQRAKSIGQFNPVYQLDFVDLGLLPAIEGEMQVRLDRLLNQALAQAIDPQSRRPSRVGEEALFRAVFRFLAAKILQDKLNPIAVTWDQDRIETILDKITQHYRLPALHVQPGSIEHKTFSAVWDCIRAGINFQNISADDLAFVYENTLVTDDIRKALGTHSTPKQVAEYVVSHLGLHKYENAPQQVHVYEPFAGAAVLLISALRHLRDLLPVELTEQERHEFLIRHMAGDEIDAFACEVSTLSLILADYPSRNGWRIHNRDLFEDGVLDAQMRAHNVILCNPPFGAFTAAERARYPIAQQTHSKAAAVLNAALDARPLALGFILPGLFIRERQFSEQRKRIEKLYGSVELVEVPDKAFRSSEVDSALLIASEPRPPAPSRIKLRSTEILDRDCQNFLRTGEVG